MHFIVGHSITDEGKIQWRPLMMLAALFLGAAALAGGVCYLVLTLQKAVPKGYDGQKFGIETVKSPVDFNRNGRDDYADFLMGARKDATNHPTYDGRYFANGFPPDNIGVCTDVIWRAFRTAGYNLRDMVDTDIRQNPQAYPTVTNRDKNIDFRRVKNLQVFFDRHGVSLSTDPNEIAVWQPGDIVVFDGGKHIGMVSDRRNAKGQSYILHNGGQREREENYLPWAQVTAHYRFDASKVERSLLLAWED